MTRKDFELIAECIRDSDVASAWKIRMANIFANRLSSTNPDFDRERFLAAALEDERS